MPVFVEFLTSVPRLRSFHMSDCPTFTDTHLQLISIHCNLLEELVVSRCANILDTGLLHLSLVAKTLTRLEIAHCPRLTSHGVKTVLQFCHELTHVDLSANYFVTDDVLLPLHNTRMLTWLQLASTPVTSLGVFKLFRDKIGLKFNYICLDDCEQVRKQVVDDMKKEARVWGGTVSAVMGRR